MGADKSRTKAGWFEQGVGAACFGIFVLIWLSSAATPFMFLTALWYSWHRMLAAILLTTAVAYVVPWMTSQSNDRGHQSLTPALQRLYATYTQKYLAGFNIIIEGNDKDKPSKTSPQTFYSVHPHGAFCIGWSLLYCSDMMQHVRFCFAPMLYAMPLFRLFSHCTGRPGSAGKADMQRYLREGDHVALPPGGFEEATLTCTCLLYTSPSPRD